MYPPRKTIPYRSYRRRGGWVGRVCRDPHPPALARVSDCMCGGGDVRAERVPRWSVRLGRTIAPRWPS
jgi:hypothetical protein